MGDVPNDPHHGGGPWGQLAETMVHAYVESDDSSLIPDHCVS